VTGIWIGLGVFCVAVAAGVAFACYHAYVSWRQLGGLPNLVAELGQLNRNVADVQRRVANVERQVADLQRQVDGLNVSLARAQILARAAGEVRDTIESVRAFVPFK
jgi:hypothetical protein